MLLLHHYPFSLFVLSFMMSYWLGSNEEVASSVGSNADHRNDCFDLLASCCWTHRAVQRQARWYSLSCNASRRLCTPHFPFLLGAREIRRLAPGLRRGFDVGVRNWLFMSILRYWLSIHPICWGVCLQMTGWQHLVTINTLVVFIFFPYICRMFVFENEEVSLENQIFFSTCILLRYRLVFQMCKLLVYPVTRLHQHPSKDRQFLHCFFSAKSAPLGRNFESFEPSSKDSIS